MTLRVTEAGMEERWAMVTGDFVLQQLLLMDMLVSAFSETSSYWEQEMARILNAGLECLK